MILLFGCSKEQPKFTPTDIHMYQKGYDDGCQTANGDYSKNHKLFNNDFDYHEGWFSGRRKCNHLGE